MLITTPTMPHHADEHEITSVNV